MIAIVDYGVGNFFSLFSSLSTLGQDAVVTGDQRVLADAQKLILPGVGAFCDAARRSGSRACMTLCSGKQPRESRCLVFAWECRCFLRKAMSTGNMRAWI